MDFSNIPTDDNEFDIWLNKKRLELKGIYFDDLKVSSCDGIKIINGTVYNGLLVHKIAKRQYNVTHIGTGAKLQYSPFENEKLAEKLVVLLLGTGVDWTLKTLDEILKDEKSLKVLDTISRLHYHIERESQALCKM